MPFGFVTGELLAQWEGMRASLFGTGGATVKGLYGAALARPRRRQQNIDEGIQCQGKNKACLRRQEYWCDVMFCIRRVHFLLVVPRVLTEAV